MGFFCTERCTNTQGSSSHFNKSCMHARKTMKRACTEYFIVKTPYKVHYFFISHSAKTLYHHRNLKNYFLGECAADISWFPFIDFNSNHSHTLYMYLIFYTMISRWGLSPKVSSLNKCIILMHIHTKPYLEHCCLCVCYSRIKKGESGRREWS